MAPENPHLFHTLCHSDGANEIGTDITLLDLFALAEVVAIGNNPACRKWRSETRLNRAYASARKALKEREKVMKKIQKENEHA